MKAACHIVSVRNWLKALHSILGLREDKTYWGKAAWTVLSGATVNVHTLSFVASSLRVQNCGVVCYKSLEPRGTASDMLISYRSCTLKLLFKGRFLKCFKKCSLNQGRVTEKIAIHCSCNCRLNFHQASQKLAHALNMFLD